MMTDEDCHLLKGVSYRGDRKMHHKRAQQESLKSNWEGRKARETQSKASIRPNFSGD